MKRKKQQANTNQPPNNFYLYKLDYCLFFKFVAFNFCLTLCTTKHTGLSVYKYKKQYVRHCAKI